MTIDKLNTMPFAFRAVLALLAGAVMALAMAPVNGWPAMFIGFSGFYALLATMPSQSRLARLGLGWIFGLGFFVAGLYWIGNALLVPGNNFKWAWPFAVLGLPVGLGIFTGLATLAATRFADLKTWRGYVVFVLCLMASEWLRGNILTGFPWNLAGYGWAGVSPMVQSVSIFGVYGLTFLTLFTCVLPGFLTVSRSARSKAIIAITFAALSLGGLYAWGTLRLKNAPVGFQDDNVIIRVVQPNIPQEQKWNNDRLVENLQKMVALSTVYFQERKTYAIIWPETAISDFIVQNDKANEFLRQSLFTNGTNHYLISGVLRHKEREGDKPLYYNSLVAYDYDMDPLAIYDKAHLVPFGEYIPFQNIIPLQTITRFSGFSTGSGNQTQSVPGIPPYSALVCYEVLFPGHAVDRHSRDKAKWIINVTNDGWYGDSPGPYQHLTKAAFRAAEEGIPLVRSANTGVSALIDSFGRVDQKIGYGVEGYFDIRLPRPTLTLYSKYRDIPLFCIWVGLAVLVTFRRGKPIP